MNFVDHRQKMLKVLYLRQHNTYANLACEFNVSRKTIGRDISVPMCTYSIEAFRGYNVGVRVTDGFYLYRRALTPQQLDPLRRVRQLITEEDQILLESILTQFNI